MCDLKQGPGLKWVRRAIGASIGVHAAVFCTVMLLWPAIESRFVLGRVWCGIISLAGGIGALIAYVSLERFVKDMARRERAVAAVKACATPAVDEQAKLNLPGGQTSQAALAEPVSAPGQAPVLSGAIAEAKADEKPPTPRSTELTSEESCEDATAARAAIALEMTRRALSVELRDHGLTDDQLDEQDAAAAAAARSVRLSGRVLLVEDAEDNQHLIRRFLRQAGVDVTLAHHGEEGVRLAKSGDYDLVLMDMQMPVMDGYRATAQLRGQGYSKPIVALTAHALADDRVKCIAAGCTDYLSKPIDRQKLLMTCAGYLKGATAEDVAADEALTNAAAQANAPAQAQGTGGALRSTLLGDKRLGRVLDKFVARLPERVAQIMTCLDAGDLDSLRQAVHNLKGAGAGYGFAALSEQASRAEATLKEVKSLEEIHRETQSLIGLIERVEGYCAESAATDSVKA